MREWWCHPWCQYSMRKRSPWAGCAVHTVRHWKQSGLRQSQTPLVSNCLISSIKSWTLLFISTCGFFKKPFTLKHKKVISLVRCKSVFSAEKSYLCEVEQSLLTGESFCFFIMWWLLMHILQPSTKNKRAFLMEKCGVSKGFFLLTVPLSVRDRRPHGGM